MKLKLDTQNMRRPVISALFLTIALMSPSFADTVADPANDFLPTFTGPHNGDLDVLSANVTLNGSNFDFTGTLNGIVGTTPGAVYVFGLNRGNGTPKFSNIGNPGVIFDSTFVIRTAGVSAVNDLIAKTSVSISDVAFSGSTISGVVPVSDLPSEGFSPDSYQFNLWPEAGAANAGNTEISDFAPNNATARVSVTPEPGTISLMGAASVLAFGLFRRRRAA